MFESVTARMLVHTTRAPGRVTASRVASVVRPHRRGPSIKKTADSDVDVAASCARHLRCQSSRWLPKSRWWWWCL